MKQSTPYHVPKEPGRWRSIALAAFVHAVLLGFLWIGVSWQNETPVTIEAEVWSPQPREAAPPPVPQPEPEPAKEPEPKPVVQEPPKPAVTEPPIEKPDIALEQEKKRKALEQKKREEREEAERIAKQKQKEKEKEEAERQAKLKKQEEEKQLLAKQKQQEALKQAEKEKAEKAKKLAEAKRKEEEAAYEKQLAKAREDEMKRLTAGIAGTGGSGDAAKSQGGRADAGYAQRLGAKIKSNTIFNAPDDLPGNPAVEYVVELLPDGSLKGTPRKVKSSGVPGFDEAVLRAIERSQPFPRNSAGVVPSSLIVSQKPKDNNP